MPVLFDSYSQSWLTPPAGALSFLFGGNVGCNWTHTFTDSGPDTMLIVAGQYHDVSNSGTSSVNVATATYAGQNLTQLATVSYAGLAEVTLFYLKNPPSTGTVQLNWSSPQVNRGCTGNSLGFKGVKHIGNIITNSGISSTPSISPTPVSNGGVLSLIVNHDDRTISSGPSSPYFAFSGDTAGVGIGLREAAGRGVLYYNHNTTSVNLSGSGDWACIGATLFGDSPFFGSM